MNNREHSKNQPFRAFEAHPQGGFPAGQVSALLARPGVGKSAALINFALDHMLRERPVLHLSLGANSDKVHQFYRQISSVFLPTYGPLENWNALSQNLVVLSYPNPRKMMEGFRSDLDTLSTHARISPALVLVDDLEFGNHLDDDLGALSQAAQSKAVSILVSVRIYRHDDGTLNLKQPLEIARRHASQVFFLDPSEHRIRLECLNDPQAPTVMPIYFNPQDHLFYCTPHAS